MTDAFSIGAWRFSPDTGELRRGEERHMLEDRAARVLAILARERGQVVGAERLIAEVWNNRVVSPNSVAVVIGDLRRALGDNARAPIYIETIAKRGYRLLDGPAGAQAKRRKPLPLAAVAAAVLVFIIGAGFVLPKVMAAPRAPIAIADVSNETGDARYAPLARAVSELVVANTSRAQAFSVVRDQTASPIVVSGRLILWSGHPSVSLMATDTRTGEVIWSGIAPGPEDSLPAQMRDRVDEMTEALSARPSAS